MRSHDNTRFYADDLSKSSTCIIFFKHRDDYILMLWADHSNFLSEVDDFDAAVVSIENEGFNGSFRALLFTQSVCYVFDGCIFCVASY